MHRRCVEGHDAAPGLVPVLELFALFFIERVADVGGAVKDHGLIEVQPGKILRRLGNVKLRAVFATELNEKTVQLWDGRVTIPGSLRKNEDPRQLVLVGLTIAVVIPVVCVYPGGGQAEQ